MSSIGDVRREAASLYRAARTGSLAPSDASRLATVLAIVAKMIEIEQIELRLLDLEDKHRADTLGHPNGSGMHLPFTQ